MIIYTIIMESFRDDKLGFYALVCKSNSSAVSSEIWIWGKDICLSLGYKYYKQVIQKENKKKPCSQDKRYLCYFLNKNGVYELINKSKKQLKNN